MALPARTPLSPPSILHPHRYQQQNRRTRERRVVSSAVDLGATLRSSGNAVGKTGRRWSGRRLEGAVVMVGAEEGSGGRGRSRWALGRFDVIKSASIELV